MENVEPQINVMKSKYLSARGKTLSFFSVIMVVCFSSGCSKESSPVIPHERFVHVYSEMLVLAELHRTEPEKYKTSLDSLLRASGVDEASMIRTAEWYTENTNRITSLYEETLLRLEEQAKSDTTAVVR